MSEESTLSLSSKLSPEIKNKLQQLTGLKLPATLVMKYPTIHLLTAYLAEQLAQLTRIVADWSALPLPSTADAYQQQAEPCSSGKIQFSFHHLYSYWPC